MRRQWFFSAVIVGLVIIGYGMAGQGTSVPSAEAKGAQASSTRQPAADFKLMDLEGQPLGLAEFRGKVVLLDFWATWCPPCREELPHFKELYAAYQGEGLEVIGISLDEGGAQVVKPFVQANGILYPIALGDSRVTQDYGGIRGIPTTFLIDKQGRIANKYVGYHDKEVFEQEIRKLLAE
jgi:peroxiredoxin